MRLTPSIAAGGDVSAVAPDTDGRAAAHTMTLEWPQVGELDPLGALVDASDAIGLSRDQARLLQARRRVLRDATRPYVARLDSLSFAHDGRLDAWLATGNGAALSLRQRAWTPKLTTGSHALATALLACVRNESRAALRDADELLTGEQRGALARLATREPEVNALLRALREAWARHPSDRSNERASRCDAPAA